MATETTRRIRCINCGELVKGQVLMVITSTASRSDTSYHTGHVDARLDQTCGTWGFRRERPSDRDV